MPHLQLPGGKKVFAETIPLYLHIHYTQLDNISIDIITHEELSLENNKELRDLLRFVY